MFSRDRQSLFAVLLDSVRLYLCWRFGRGSSLPLWAFLVSVIRFLCSAQRVMDLPPCSVSAIGRVTFRLIFLPVRVLDGIAELLPRREISLGSNLSLMAFISRLADRRCPCSGISRFAASLSVIDFSILGASVSLIVSTALALRLQFSSIHVLDPRHVGQLQRSVAYGPLQPCVKRVWDLLRLGYSGSLCSCAKSLSLFSWTRKLRFLCGLGLPWDA